MNSLKTKYTQYYVEGDDEQKLIDVLKNKLFLIKPGNVQKLNVIEKTVTDAHMRRLKTGTMVVLVFDTDTEHREVLDANIKRLTLCKTVTDVILIPQVKNLEDEIIRATDIKSIKDFLGSRSNKDFKHDFLNEKKLETKFKEHSFDINKFWSTSPTGVYNGIESQAEKIKLK